MQSISLRGWLVLAVCALCPGLTYAVIIMGYPFWAGAWIAEFHVPRSTAILSYTLGGLGLVLMGALVGRALDRISIRAAVTIGGLVMAAGVAAAALAPSFWIVLLLAATVIPAGAAFFGQLPAQTLATRMFPAHTGLANGIISAGLSLSGVVMALVAPPLVAAVGWRGAFLVLAGVIALVATPLAWLFYADPAGDPVKAEPGAPPVDQSTQGFAVMRQPAFWLLLASVVPMFAGLSAVAPAAVDIANDAGLGVTVGAAMVSAFSIAAVVGALGGGWLCDRLDLRVVYAMIGAAFLAAFAILALRPTEPLLLAAMTLIGLAGSSTIPWMAATVATRFGPEAFGRVLGLAMAFTIPAGQYPILIAWLREATGSYRLGYLVTAVIVGLALTTLATMRGLARTGAGPARVTP